MGNFKEDIVRTEAFVFDVDGVMTDGGIIPTLDGDFIRRYNAKDGYALAYAIKMGYKVCIITGGRGKTLENRLKMLGVTRAYIDCMDKISALHEYFAEEGIDPRNAIYMGDDIPDLECMREVDIPVCPAAAAAEVIEASRYVSEFKGGEGAVRDIVEQVLRARGDWAKNSEGVTPSSLAASR
ncbi:MAG: HAD hydrolase family protein [Alistipes sp.]|uniref:KdsC family phosphatase n=1 Tax=Alistipes sp. TaxID=1872444 RepID=UPI0025BE9A59|nr:HAD hydrolase family protein [Alistipes sp.]MCD8275182.1 HAD hydrolase family protein [Alistipes sp.]